MNEGRPKADRCNAPKARRRFPVVRGACHYRREGEARPLQRVEDKTTILNIVAYRRQSRSTKNDEKHEKKEIYGKRQLLVVFLIWCQNIEFGHFLSSSMGLLGVFSLETGHF